MDSLSVGRPASAAAFSAALRVSTTMSMRSRLPQSMCHLRSSHHAAACHPTWPSMILMTHRYSGTASLRRTCTANSGWTFIHSVIESLLIPLAAATARRMLPTSRSLHICVTSSGVYLVGLPPGCFPLSAGGAVLGFRFTTGLGVGSGLGARGLIARSSRRGRFQIRTSCTCRTRASVDHCLPYSASTRDRRVCHLRVRAGLPQVEDGGRHSVLLLATPLAGLYVRRLFRGASAAM